MLVKETFVLEIQVEFDDSETDNSTVVENLAWALWEHIESDHNREDKLRVVNTREL